MFRIGLVCFCTTSLVATTTAPVLSQEAVALPRRYNDALLLAGNIAIGALTAGISRIVRHEPLDRAMLYGALGGAVGEAGKVIVAQNYRATNLFGREVAAVGSSIVASAATKHAPLHLMFPWGPFHLHVEPANSKARLRIDLANLIATIAALRDRDLHFDGDKSFTYGLAVFKVDSAKRSGGLGGSQIAGVVRYRSESPYMTAQPSTIRAIIGHELVHVAQSDIAFTTLSAPLESCLFQIIPGGRVVGRYFDLGLQVPALGVLNGVIPYKSQPWEREAVTFVGR